MTHPIIYLKAWYCVTIKERKHPVTCKKEQHDLFEILPLRNYT